MDADLIAYEAMLAARESANWAYLGLWISLSAAVSTFLATAAGVVVVFGWRNQEAFRDKKAFVISVLKLQQTIGLGPNKYQLTSEPIPETHPFSKLTFTLHQVYENVVTMTKKKDRAKAKQIYLQLSEVYESLSKGEVDREIALRVLFEIKVGPFFENF